MNYLIVHEFKNKRKSGQSQLVTREKSLFFLKQKNLNLGQQKGELDPERERFSVTVNSVVGGFKVFQFFYRVLET